MVKFQILISKSTLKILKKIKISVQRFVFFVFIDKTNIDLLYFNAKTAVSKNKTLKII